MSTLKPFCQQFRDVGPFVQTESRLETPGMEAAKAEAENARRLAPRTGRENIM